MLSVVTTVSIILVAILYIVTEDVKKYEQRPTEYAEGQTSGSAAQQVLLWAPSNHSRGFGALSFEISLHNPKHSFLAICIIPVPESITTATTEPTATVSRGALKLAMALAPFSRYEPCGNKDEYLVLPDADGYIGESGIVDSEHIYASVVWAVGNKAKQQYVLIVENHNLLYSAQYDFNVSAVFQEYSFLDNLLYEFNRVGSFISSQMAAAVAALTVRLKYLKHTHGGWKAEQLLSSAMHDRLLVITTFWPDALLPSSFASAATATVSFVGEYNPLRFLLPSSCWSFTLGPPFKQWASSCKAVNIDGGGRINQEFAAFCDVLFSPSYIVAVLVLANIVLFPLFVGRLQSVGLTPFAWHTGGIFFAQRALSATFAHMDVFHLLTNALCLLSVGTHLMHALDCSVPLFLAIYCFSAYSGAVVTCWWRSDGKLAIDDQQDWGNSRSRDSNIYRFNRSSSTAQRRVDSTGRLSPAAKGGYGYSREQQRQFFYRIFCEQYTGQHFLSVGASGAVMGVSAALLVLRPLNTHIRLLGTHFQGHAMTFVLISLVQDMLLSVLTARPVDVACHVGGALGGYAAATFIMAVMVATN